LVAVCKVFNNSSIFFSSYVASIQWVMWQHQADYCLLQSMMRSMITMAKSDRNNHCKDWQRMLCLLLSDRLPLQHSLFTVFVPFMFRA
jgi:hypothetical protein